MAITSAEMTFYNTFRQETDRAAAVLGAAYMDDYLEKVFRLKLRADVPKTIFSNRGPLGDFSGKIDLAFGLGWIHPLIRRSLHIIRDIRNDFAHDPNFRLSFSNQSVADRARSLENTRLLNALITDSDADSPECEFYMYCRDHLVPACKVDRATFQMAVTIGFSYFHGLLFRIAGERA